jgi:hypothetical protein
MMHYAASEEHQTNLKSAEERGMLIGLFTMITASIVFLLSSFNGVY